MAAVHSTGGPPGRRSPSRASTPEGDSETDGDGGHPGGTDAENEADDEEDELTADDVTRAFNEGDPDAQDILNRYNCQKARALPDNHWLKPHCTARFC